MVWTICACIVSEKQVELDSEVSKYFMMETMWLRLGSLTSKQCSILSPSVPTSIVAKSSWK